MTANYNAPHYEILPILIWCLTRSRIKETFNTAVVIKCAVACFTRRQVKLFLCLLFKDLWSLYIPPRFYVLSTGNVFSARFEMNLCR